MGRDSAEDEVVKLEEDQQEDPSLKLGCDKDDIFNDGITDFQLEHATNAPTQEENPKGPDQSPEVLELPPPVPMEGIESEQNSAPLRNGQDMRTPFSLLHLLKKSLQVRETPDRKLSRSPSRA